ncbi:MAG: 23S rRNA (pseudouridine(1915)-N(3))-methyltransferase RlmH [Alphaproteobacteria bacterium]|nr:23S rRNA (pseudouridine(1915)-N(3))-methyltransferase RlmH [Alphaproteobacteria bacterium]
MTLPLTECLGQLTFRINIIAVGRMKTGPESQQMAAYLKRCPWPVTVVEVEEKRPIRGSERKLREGDLILKALSNIDSGAAYVIILDERGKSVGSRRFADLIRNHRDNGIANLVFIIGGAGGCDPRVSKRADFLLSLSDMTWPHMLARVMLMEQLYRASCILSGHPYHKD